MRDIADTLAFLAIKTLTDGGFDLGPDRKNTRRALTDAFADLLNRLPEGDVPEIREADPPLGYVALSKSRLLDGGWRYRLLGSAGWVHETAGAAAKYCAVSSDERAYVVAEVSREVQP